MTRIAKLIRVAELAMFVTLLMSGDPMVLYALLIVLIGTELALAFLSRCK